MRKGGHGWQREQGECKMQKTNLKKQGLPTSGKENTDS